MNNSFINKKGYADHPYRVLFKGQQICVYGKSLAAAKQTAIEHFKPKKSEVEFITVKVY